MQDINIGQLIFSKAGRDKGNPFLVVEVAEGYVYLVDGKMRRLDQPKKKKIKHIQPTHWISHDLAEEIRSYGKLTNADIQKEIAALVEKNTEKEE
ncbi:RNA-binding protein [Clostridiales bacterium COT073_COT-073]|nr:RNA-binding protein [Clostridiales bacterium COT073_COT-073]